MKQFVILVLIITALVTPTQAASVDLVTVGNPGNADDDTGYGSVTGAYNIGKYEVTAGKLVVGGPGLNINPIRKLKKNF